ncbi:hypothetical protein BGZ96_003175, partial [Linnemannia gamsii]
MHVRERHSTIDQDWSVAGQGKQRKRGRAASSGGGVTSASDSDSSKPPPRKQAPHHQGSTRASRPTSTHEHQAKTVLNAAIAPSAPSISKADHAVASVKSEQATPSQEPAKADEAAQLSSLGDTPKQQTDLQQQETPQQPVQEPVQEPGKQPEHEPAQQSNQHTGQQPDLQAPTKETTTHIPV